MNEEVKKLFIRVWQTAHNNNPEAICTCGPEMILNRILNSPERYVSPVRDMLASYLEQHREECLKIIAAVGGLC